MNNEDEVFIAFDDSNDEFHEAKLQELNKWKLFKVYEEVNNEGQKCLSGRWVFSRKQDADGNEQLKARFVVRGFQEKVDIQSDSPTGSKECMRLALVIIASKGWILHSLDVKAAFLQGTAIERAVFLKPPQEAAAAVGRVWKLKKCVYGLNDAARTWYFSVLEKLEALGCVRSKVDFGVFLWFENGILSGILETHVDDFLWAGTSLFAEDVIKNLCQSFNIGSQFQETFLHLGLNIAQCDDKIYVDQITYIESIESIDISTNRLNARGEYCTQKESHSFRKLVGKLNWVGGQTRPDILFNVCSLSSVMESPRISDLILGNKVVRKLKDHPVKICYPGLGDLDNCQIMEYSDASLANLPSGKSVGGYVLFISNANSDCCPILWKSNTI